MKRLTCEKCGWSATQDMLTVTILKDMHCPGCGAFMRVDEVLVRGDEVK